jgi:predicted GIY-YIG superfamily endonuclease
MRWNKTQYCVYITTNYTGKALYTGVTNNLEQRIIEHYLDKIKRNRILDASYFGMTIFERDVQS